MAVAVHNFSRSDLCRRMGTNPTTLIEALTVVPMLLCHSPKAYPPRSLSGGGVVQEKTKASKSVVVGRQGGLLALNSY